MTNDESAEEIVRALRAECEDCSEFGRDDKACHAVLAYCPTMDAAAIIESLSAEIAKLLERIAEMEGHLSDCEAERQELALRADTAENTNSWNASRADELEAKLSASQQRERAELCIEQTTNRGMDISGEYDVDANLLCPKCGAVVGDAEYRELNGPYCHKCGQRLAIGPQGAGEGEP